jgi:hypothetical protein
VPRGPTRRSLLFLHVAKTGGTTFGQVISNRFPAEDCLSLYVAPQPDLADLDRYLYVSGHLTLAFLDQFEYRPFVVTCLRDPVDRALSLYSYLRSFPWEAEQPILIFGRGRDAHERRAEAIRLARECSIEEFIRRAPAIAVEVFGNRQARGLCGSMPEGGDESLDDAIEGLERCDFVAISERLDESASWLARRLGWRDLGPLPRANVTSGRLGREQASARAMDALLELTSIDRELYRNGLRHYERQVATWSAAPDPRDLTAEIPDAPLVSDVRFGDAIPGGGWLGRERLEAGPSFCWIGDTRIAWLDLAAERGAGSVLVEIAHVLDPRILDTLRISINGQHVPHSLEAGNDGLIASAQLPAEIQRSGEGVARVQLEVAGTARPCDIDPESSDSRELALAVRRVALLPGLD